MRPGSLGPPKRGVGRLALEAGVPVLPVAVIGTEAVRRGWRVRPHHVRIRCGRALRFPQRRRSLARAGGHRDRSHLAVRMLQWEWLGGLPPLRRAAVIGAGAWGTALAVALARAGLEVDLGWRTASRPSSSRERENARYLPGVRSRRGASGRAADLELSRQDLVCFAVPSAALPAAVAAHAGAISSARGRAGRVQGRRAPAGHAAHRLRGRRVRARATGAWPAPRTPRRRSSAARRWWSPPGRGVRPPARRRAGRRGLRGAPPPT